MDVKSIDVQLVADVFWLLLTGAAARRIALPAHREKRTRFERS